MGQEMIKTLDGFYRKAFVKDNGSIARYCILLGGVISGVGVASGLLLSNWWTLWAGSGVVGWGLISVIIALSSRGGVDAVALFRRRHAHQPKIHIQR